MTYMQSNLAFARGIQELSVDEIGFVSGGFGDDIDQGFFTPQGLDDWGAGKKKKKKKEDDSLPTPPKPPKKWNKVTTAIYVAQAVVYLAETAYDWATSDNDE
jgi:hypothetical protein